MLNFLRLSWTTSTCLVAEIHVVTTDTAVVIPCDHCAKKIQNAILIYFRHSVYRVSHVTSLDSWQFITQLLHRYLTQYGSTRSYEFFPSSFSIYWICDLISHKTPNNSCLFSPPFLPTSSTLKRKSNEVSMSFVDHKDPHLSPMLQKWCIIWHISFLQQ